MAGQTAALAQHAKSHRRAGTRYSCLQSVSSPPGACRRLLAGCPACCCFCARRSLARLLVAARPIVLGYQVSALLVSRPAPLQSAPAVRSVLRTPLRSLARKPAVGTIYACTMGHGASAADTPPPSDGQHPTRGVAQHVMLIRELGGVQLSADRHLVCTGPIT